MFACRNTFLAVAAALLCAALAPRPAEASIPRAIENPQLTQTIAAPTLPTAAPSYVLLYVVPDGSCQVEFCRNDPVNVTDPTGLQGAPTQANLWRELFPEDEDDVPNARRAARELQVGLKVGTEVVISFNPGVNAADAISGQGQLSGKQLRWWERALSALVFLKPASEANVLRKGIGEVSALRRLERVEEEARAVTVAEREIAGLGAAKTGVKYHYTDAPEASFKKGLWSQSSVTDNPHLTPQQAVEQLGVKRPPDKIVPIRDGGNFVPNKPPIVQRHPLGPGGGADFTNPIKVPPEDILPAIPIGGGS
jgi:hypothetical protein